MSSQGQRPVHTTTDLFQNLLWLPSKPRLIVGLIAMTVGAILTVVFWQKGVIWFLTIFAVVGGFGLSLTGFLDMKKEAKLRAYRESIRRRVPELLNGLAEAKRQGQNLVRWLNEQGVVDVETRARLIEILNNRLKAAPPARRTEGNAASGAEG